MTPTAPALHRSFLVWRNGRYAKLAAALSIVAGALYLIAPAGHPAYGGTLLGYTLGTAGLLLIAWLAWFGIRRRRYGGAGSLENLLSAHVYFGLALVVLVTLHTGFRFHWNVHTLAYGLMLGVVASGIFGAYAFWRYPPLMTANRAGAPLSAMAGRLAALDQRCCDLALAFPDDILSLVTAATARPPGRPVPPAAAPTLAAIAGVQRELGRLAGTSPVEVLGLVQGLTERLAMLDRLARDRRYRALMLLWRAVHVPLTLGLLVALFVHVFAVFYYW